MSTQNFKIKNGLSIGDNEIIDSSGNLTLPTGATINVGGAPLDALPEQSGQTGKYLSTDGADASWETITQYTPPTDQGSGNFLAGDGTYKAIDVSTDIATAVAALVDSAPSTLDTLNELAASLGDDANFATSVSTSLGTKVDKTTTVNGHALSGNVIVTKSDVSLGNVDNTSDDSKPVSTAQATAIGLKADSSTVSSHTGNTSNPHSVTKAQVGLSNVDNTADTAKPVSTAQQTALNLKADLASPTFTGTVAGITKAMVGLGNVDNTSDANKPVSTAQQTALNLKANLTNADFSGNTSAMMAMTADNIPVGTSTTIPSGKQLVVDHLDVLGTLDVQGTLATTNGGYLSQTTMKTQAIAHTNGTNAINIDSIGNVGIGTNSPSSLVDIKAQGSDSRTIRSRGRASDNISYIQFTDNAATTEYASIVSGASYLRFDTTGTERMRIDSAGRVTMPYQPAFCAYGGVLPANGSTYIFTSTNVNVGNNYSTSTGRFTAPISGSYLISAQLFVSVTGTTQANVKINNGVDIFEIKANTNEGSYNSINGCKVVYLNSGDFVSMQWNGGGTLTGNAFTYLSGHLIG